MRSSRISWRVSGPAIDLTHVGDETTHEEEAEGEEMEEEGSGVGVGIEEVEAPVRSEGGCETDDRAGGGGRGATAGGRKR